MRFQKGFTLIELMTTLTIIAVIVAVAIPGYQRYMIKNAESQAQARMASLQLELEKWRANTLTYREFTPRNANGSFAYDADNKTIYVPIGSNDSNAKYEITLVNGNGDSLVGVNTMERARQSNSWVMLATPRESVKGASRILLTSTGKRCKVVSDDFCATVKSSCTCTSEQSW